MNWVAALSVKVSPPTSAPLTLQLYDDFIIIAWIYGEFNLCLCGFKKHP